jgi:AmmeMemoRadiSam system protein B/AmmeMemoRadiSam system protein A
MRILLFFLALLPLCALSLCAKRPSSSAKQEVRPMAVAGSFYPADPAELGKMLDQFLAAAKVPAVPDLVAIVAPHAGYQFSGPVAAYSYALLKGRKPQRVVVIAPSHYEAFDFSSVYDGAAYSTPLGQVPVDREFVNRLVRMDPSIQLSATGHTPTADKREHALEVQLPFLQRVLGEFKLVPIVMGDQSWEKCRALGVALAKLSQGSDTLIVASSDLSHYHPYDDAVSMDHKTLQGIEEWDYLSMQSNFDQRNWEACGGGPIIATMIAAERMGATEARLLKYANSGDATGDHSRVVGYGAVAFSKGPARSLAQDTALALSQEEKDELLRIARTSVETAVREGKPYQCPAPKLSALASDRAVFVTLTKRGDLRGCIGYVHAMKPLYLAVSDVAAMAALQDSRFLPVSAGELGELNYEISVLSPLRHVQDVSLIRVGLHGLLIRKGDTQGLLLPQVATEYNWDRLTFLQQACRKAGLPADAWRDSDTDIFVFTAVVFAPAPRAALQEFRLPAWMPQPGALAPDSPMPAAATF